MNADASGEVPKYDESGRTPRQGQEEKELFARLSRKRWCIVYVFLRTNEWKTLKKACCIEHVKEYTLVYKGGACGRELAKYGVCVFKLVVTLG